jgi:hypothetical protein
VHRVGHRARLGAPPPRKSPSPGSPPRNSGSPWRIPRRPRRRPRHTRSPLWWPWWARRGGAPHSPGDSPCPAPLWKRLPGRPPRPRAGPPPAGRPQGGGGAPGLLPRGTCMDLRVSPPRGWWWVAPRGVEAGGRRCRGGSGTCRSAWRGRRAGPGTGGAALQAPREEGDQHRWEPPRGEVGVGGRGQGGVVAPRSPVSCSPRNSLEALPDSFLALRAPRHLMHVFRPGSNPYRTRYDASQGSQCSGATHPPASPHGPAPPSPRAGRGCQGDGGEGGLLFQSQVAGPALSQPCEARARLGEPLHALGGAGSLPHRLTIGNGQRQCVIADIRSALPLALLQACSARGIGAMEERRLLHPVARRAPSHRVRGERGTP